MKKEDALEVCRLIIEEGHTVTQCCKDAGIHRNQFFKWVNEDEAVFNEYARARQVQCHAWIDEIITIADRPSGDSVENADKRQMIDTRKWAASKALPKIYGDKLDITSAGEKITNIPISQWADDKKPK